MDYRELRGKGENPSPDPLGWLIHVPFRATPNLRPSSGPTQCSGFSQVSQQQSPVDISNLVLSGFDSVSMRLLAPSTYRSQLIVVGA